MNRVDDLYIGTEYALFAPLREVLLDLEEVIVFGDMSNANLTTGEYENKSPGIEFTIVKLIDGENRFTFGKANQKPKKVNGYVTTIDINYPGVVQIIPCETETSFLENRFCFGNVSDETLTITSTILKEITYIHTRSGSMSFTG